MNDKWEYLREMNPTEDGLNHIGEQGWELVAVMSKPVDPKAATYSGTGQGGFHAVYIFKRRKQD